MNIAIVCRYLTAARGGHERYLKRLIAGLTGRGWGVTAFSGAFDPDCKEMPGLECVNVPFRRFPQWLRYLSFNRNAREAVAARRAEFDLVLTTEYVTFGDLYRAGAGIARAEIKACSGLTGRLSLKNRVKMGLQKRLLENTAPRLIVNSESMRRQIQTCYDVPCDRIELVYNGIDADVFSAEHAGGIRAAVRYELGVGEEEFVCLAIGSNWRRKGLDRVLNVLSERPEEGLRLLIVGSEEKELRRMVRPGEGRAVFCAPTSFILRYYAAADLCIVASRYDPAPNVILEALACGLPVAVSAECGLTELVEKGDCGAVFQSRKELADLVGHFLTIKNSQRYRDVKKNAESCGRKFTMDRHLTRIMEIMETEINV